MHKIFSILSIAIFCALVMSCGKDSDDTTPPATTYALIVKSGGQSLAVGGKFTFEAQMVGTDGVITPISSGISYTSSNTDVASFSGSTVSGVKEGTSIITASYTFNGKAYSTQVPLVVQPPQNVFAVNPWTIWWQADGTEFELNTIYFGTTMPTYTYASSDATVASVSASGVVKVLKAGNCVITVTATNLTGKPSVEVPVLVFGEITAPLGVTQVKITPGSYEMFKGEDKSFVAKAYNSAGAEVTGKTIKWSIRTTDSVDAGAAASIDANGKVTALRVGEAALSAEIEGIVCQANITINPDYAIVVNPLLVTIPKSRTKVFTATTYKVDRTKYRANAPDALSVVPNPASLKWELPLAGLPGFENPFTIESSNSNEATIRTGSSMLEGLPGYLLAYVEDDTYAPGIATMILGGDCDCGDENNDVASISVASSVSITITFPGPSTKQLNAKALNAGGTEVTSANIRYCVAGGTIGGLMVDDTGLLSASFPGTYTVTVCVGSVQKTVNVEVSL